MKQFSVFKFLAIFFLTQFLISCGEKFDGPASISVKIPEQLPSQKLTSSATVSKRSFAPGDQRDIWSPAFAPNNKNELNCFGVVIAGNSDELTTATNTCEASDGSEFNFGKQKMGANPGDELKFEELEPGQTIVLRVLGWRAENAAACESLKEGSAVEAKQLSHPFVIAQQEVELESGDNDITINASFGSARELINCNNLTPKLNSFSTRDFTIGGTVFNNKPEFVPGRELILSLILTKEDSNNPAAQARIIQQEVRGDGPGVIGEPPREGEEEADRPVILRDGQPFDIQIAQQPSGKTCTVNNGRGVIEGDSYLDATVTCEDIPFNVGGAVIGLVEDEGIYNGEEGGGELVLGMFNFPALGEFDRYEELFLAGDQVEPCIGIDSPGPCGPEICAGPQGPVPCGFDEICAVDEGPCFEGPGQDGPTFISLTENGTFQFDRTVLHNDNVDVFIASQPIGQSCFIENGFQTIFEADISNVSINCSPNQFFVSGNVSGLIAGRTLQLALASELQEGPSTISVQADGGFLFPEGVTFNTDFNVSIAQQPAGMSCSIVNGGGNRTMPAFSVGDVSVACTPLNFNIGGTITGIVGGRSIALRLSSGEFTEVKTFPGNGTDNFNGVIPSGQIFSVSVETAPVGHNCSVEPSSGTVFDSNIVGSVTCTPQSFTVGGLVGGLIEGRSIGLQLQHGDNLEQISVSSNSSFSFEGAVRTADVYNVSVFSQPAGMTCNVTNGVAEMFGQNVSNIGVVCTPLPFGVGGSVSGLIAGRSFDIMLNGEIEQLTISGNGGFQFATTVDSGEAYTVELLEFPAGQSCSVTNGEGTILASNITDVSINCTPLNFTIQNSISNLIEGRSLQLSLFGIDAETEETVVIETVDVEADGSVSFESTVASGQFYSVEVTTPAVGMDCFADTENAEGTAFDENISIEWVCSPDELSVSVAINGIVNEENHVNISLAEGENILETVNLFAGEFTFDTSILSGQFYTVLLNESAFAHTCEVANGSGEALGENITNVEINCTPESFFLSAQVSGLINGRSVSLQNNGANTASGTADAELGQPVIDFGNAVPFFSPVNVTVSSQPVGQTCTVDQGGIETMPEEDTTVAVNCTPLNFTVGGSITGLIEGRSLEIGFLGDEVGTTFTADQDFTLATLASGSFYSVEIFSQPAGMNCSVTNAAGTVLGANITNIEVACAPLSFTIGGTVVGHPANEADFVRIQNNGADTQDIFFNGPFSFSVPVASGQDFDITVTQNPTDFTCEVTGGAGTVLDQNITTPVISCTENTFTIGGSISGLAEGESVVISQSESENIGLSSDGNWGFPTAVTNGTEYVIFVVTQPETQTCEITNGEGSVSGANVTDISIVCTDNPTIAAGTIDGTFNGGLGAISIDRAEDTKPRIELDSQGRLQVIFNRSSSIESCRFDSAGAADGTYGLSGCINISTVGGAVAVPENFILDSNDRAIITGQRSGSEMFIAALLNTGVSLDSTFGDSAGFTSRTNSCDSALFNSDLGLAVVADNASPSGFFVGGKSTASDESEAHSWWKFTNSGLLDTGFFQNGAIAGHTCANESTTDPERVVAVKLDASGNLVSLGSNFVAGTTEYKITKLNPVTGTPDASFGGGTGAVSFNIGGIDEPRDLIINPDGTIIVAGTGGPTGDAVMVKRNADGSGNLAFGVDGIATLDVSAESSIEKMELDSAGNIVVGGIDIENQTGFVARFLPDGTLDTSFGTNGIIGVDARVTDLAIDEDGNIYVTSEESAATTDILIFKIN